MQNMNNQPNSKIFDFTCPNSPNCVSSLTHQQSHKIEPLKFETTELEAINKIEAIIKNMKRTKIVLKTDKKLHAVFSSAVFRFKDDVFFEIKENNIIHIKSASRTGHYDFGVNKKRVEQIKQAFYKETP